MKVQKATLVNRLTRNGVPASIANALAQSGLLTYEQSRSVTGHGTIKQQALDIYEAAANKATIRRVWNDAREDFDYEVKTPDRTIVFTNLKEARGTVWIGGAEAVYQLCAFGRELRTLTREVKK